MALDDLYMDLLAFAPAEKPAGGLESRMVAFLEAEPTTESLDGAAFSKVNNSQPKADYFLGGRRLVAELKTVNASPLDRTEQRLKARLAQPGAPIIFGKVAVSKVVETLSDREAIEKMMVDMAGRSVRKHLKKANDQISAIKRRFDLADAAGLLILMNDAEPMIDAAAIGYTLKTAFETHESGFPYITNVWVSIESHRIAMPGGRTGYPQLHLFRSLERQAELDFMARMLGAWGGWNGGRMERLPHRGEWDVMRPIYEGGPPTLRPFE